MIDYEALLYKYIQHVRLYASVPVPTQTMQTYDLGESIEWTPDELATLKTMDERAHEDDSVPSPGTIAKISQATVT